MMESSGGNNSHSILLGRRERHNKVAGGTADWVQLSVGSQVADAGHEEL
jgi:hypothetical protein